MVAKQVEVLNNKEGVELIRNWMDEAI